MASSDVLRPVAGVRFFVVEEAADAKLLGGRAVPTSPVAGARGLVAKNTVKPVTVVCTDGRIVAFAAAALCTVRVVADADEPLAAVARVDKAVGTSSENGLVVGARATVELVVMVAVFVMRQSPLPGLAVLLRVIRVDGVGGR